MRSKILLGLFVIVVMAIGVIMMTSAKAEQIGSIELDSGFMSLTSYSLNVQAFDDPEIKGVTCHVSDVAIGGVGSWLSDDPSNASIACRQTGQIVINNATENNPWGSLNLSGAGEDVFGTTKGWFKSLKVTRIVDQKRRVLIYVVYTPKWGEDSKKNVVSTISLFAQKQQ